MHVPELFNPLPVGAHVEVVKPLLPHWTNESFAFPQQSGEALLYHLHDNGWVSNDGHGHQQVNVFRHDHLSQKREAVAVPRVFQDSEKQIAPRSCPKMLLPPIAAEGDEVEGPLEVMAL
jgi:hypothetical protein